MMRTYKYNGKIDIHLANIGNVKPGKQIIAVEPINHPDFEEITEPVKRQPEVITK